MKEEIRDCTQPHVVSGITKTPYNNRQFTSLNPADHPLEQGNEELKTRQNPLKGNNTAPVKFVNGRTTT